jgi:hypothetical protein
MKRFCLLFLTFLLASTSLFASQPDTTVHYIRRKHPFAYNGYQGGMMFNIGYVQSRNFQFTDLNQHPLGDPMQLKGASMGIGGALRVGFGKYLRVGIEGYVSTHKYGPNASSAKVGWGGFLLDSHWHIKRWTIFTGGVIGGGSYTHTTLINHDNSITNYPNDFVVENQYVSYRHYPFLVLNPFVGCEYSLTKRISAVAKIDYMLNATNWADDFATGPRFFIGFMFGR